MTARPVSESSDPMSMSYDEVHGNISHMIGREGRPYSLL